MGWGKKAPSREGHLMMKVEDPQKDHLMEECPAEEDHPVEEDHLGEKDHLGEEDPLEGGSLLEERPFHKELHGYLTEKSQKLLSSLENEKMPDTSSSSLPEDSTLNDGPPLLNEKRSAIFLATSKTMPVLGPIPLSKGHSNPTPSSEERAGEEEVSAAIGLRNLVYTYDKPIADFNEEFDWLAHRAEITEESALMAWCWEKLPSTMRVRIMERDVAPTTLEGWKEAAVQRDRAYRNNKAIDAAQRTSRTPS
ncbi:hypothetical protein AcW2_007586 [Taiwanofungus camphoratus]|nr:hypothetical protein AcW2_007586 [Antrodia cinnamomea]